MNDELSISDIKLGPGKEVVKGWGLSLMGRRVGGKPHLFVPARLACGEQHIGTRIKPNSNLRVGIELLEVITRDG